MKFSIITPSYNQAKYIRKTLASVEQQTVKDYEHLIFDPGSTDGSVEIISKFCADAPRSKVFFGEDRSQTHAINLGFSRSKGEILAWINSDDFYSTDQILQSIQEQFDSDSSADIVYGRGTFVSPEGTKLKEAFVHRDSGNLRKLLANSLGILQPSLFIRRSSFLRAGLLDERMNFSFDYEYWARCASMGLRFKFIDLLVSEATIHDSAKTIRSRDVSLSESVEVAKRYYGFLSLDWVKRVVDQQVSGSDGITTTSDAVPESLLKERFAKENSDQRSLTKYFNAVATMNAATQKGFSDWVLPNIQRAFVSAWDANYFDMGITLIASIHRSDPGSVVFVCDIGMTDEQLEFVRLLKGVVLLNRDFPAYSADWQTQPKNYVFKNVLFSTLSSKLAQSTSMLWIDAGVLLSKSADEIFRKIETDGHFFINHDDSRHWPLFNASFTSDDAIVAAGFSWSEMAGPHVCSCLFGLRTGSPSEAIFGEATKLASNIAIAAGDKHPPDTEKKKSAPKSDQVNRAKELENKSYPIDDLADLRRVFGYFGHRQDQSILSALASRFGANISSAKLYCPANENSSAVSKENWFEGVSKRLGEHQKNDFDPGGVTFHHRGLVKDFSGLQFDYERKAVSAILGNGPSLAGVDVSEFEGCDTVGMNAAYRYWEEIQWYPTIYCCLDTVVGMSHKEAIIELVRHRKRFGIEQFLIRRNLFDWLHGQSCTDGVICFDLIRKGFYELLPEPVTTGSHSLGWAAAVGYTRFAVAGVDCNYVEMVEGAQKAADKTLEIVAEAKNPNYFFDGYQKVGDKFNVPNFSKDLHIRSWRNVGGTLRDQCVVINVSLDSRMDAFPKAPLRAALDVLLTDGTIDRVAAVGVVEKIANLMGEVESLTSQLNEAKGAKQISPELAVPPPTPELEQLRKNYRELSAFAQKLEKLTNGVGFDADSTPFGKDFLTRLQSGGDVASSRMLLTSIGSGLLAQDGGMLGRVKHDTDLIRSIETALGVLSADDPHKVHFMRVRARFGETTIAAR